MELQFEAALNEISLVSNITICSVHLLYIHYRLLCSCFYCFVYFPGISKRTKHMDANTEVLVVIDNSIYKQFLTQNHFSVHEAKQKIHQYYSILFSMVSSGLITVFLFVFLNFRTAFIIFFFFINNLHKGCDSYF